MLCCTAAGLFLIAAVAVRAAGGKGVLPHRICRAAGLAHRIIQVAQGGREVIQAKLLHQRTDAALGEATLTAAAICFIAAMSFTVNLDFPLFLQNQRIGFVIMVWV